MLAALGDPVTRVVPERAPAAESKREPPALFRRLDDGTLAIHLRPDLDEVNEKMLIEASKALAAALPAARTVVVDIRGLGYRYQAEYPLQSLAALLASRPVAAPAQRYRFHSGYRNQLGESSGGYDSGFQTLLAERFSPPAGAVAKRVAFLVNADTVLPPVAMALQAAGDGEIVAEGALGDEAFVMQRQIDLGEGWEAVVRTAEILPQPAGAVRAPTPKWRPRPTPPVAIRRSRRRSGCCVRGGRSRPPALGPRRFPMRSGVSTVATTR
jgi:hypothetical protein